MFLPNSGEGNLLLFNFIYIFLYINVRKCLLQEKVGVPPPSPILLGRNLTDIVEHLLYLNCTSLHFHCHCASLYISTNQHFTPLFATVQYTDFDLTRLNVTVHGTDQRCTQLYGTEQSIDQHSTPLFATVPFIWENFFFFSKSSVWFFPWYSFWFKCM